jgi:hypothetical protein
MIYFAQLPTGAIKIGKIGEDRSGAIPATAKAKGLSDGEA